MSLSSNRLLVIVAATGGLPLAVVGCGTTDGPPCFDGTYEVEFLERLPESNCPEPWAAGWAFTVEPVGVGNRPDTCRACAVEIVGQPPPRAIGTATGKVIPYPVIEAGVVQAIDADVTACEAIASVGVFIPDTGYENVAGAAADDAMVWRVAVNDIAAECGVAVPEDGRCTDYYRSRMTKVADWDPE